MNDHFASIVHRDRMAQYRQEADASGLTAARNGGLRFGRIKLAAAALIAALLAIGASSAVSAHEPTCSDLAGLGVVVHGQHVVRDYVMGAAALDWPPAGVVGGATGGKGAAIPGGPGPGFHFVHNVAPGASFCNPQSRSPGDHVE